MKVAGGLTVACFVVLGACALAPTPPPAPPRQTSLGLQVSKYELTNGLRVVLVRDLRAAELQVTMRYRVGSVDDPPDQAGVAHLVEHLMFQQVLGTQSLFAKLENIATYFNASTTFDATTYVQRAQATHLDELLSIEAVRIGFRCTSITDAVFLREREVVVNEVRQRDYATEVLLAIHAGLYPKGHPYRRPVGGTEESVAAITRAQACAFADAHYAPTNAVLVVSGDISVPQLEASLNRFLGRVARRPVSAGAGVPRAVHEGRSVQVPAPIDDAALLVAWPLPEDPQLAAKVRAVAAATQGLVDAEVRGQSMLLELGDRHAPMIGVIVVPALDETIADARAGAERGITSTPLAFGRKAILGELVFDRIQQTAIYKLFATLEDGGDRDTRLAAFVLAGRDPSTALGAEIQGLRRMTREEAAEIARDNLAFSRATVVVLEPSDRKKRGHGIRLTPAIHDLGQRRDPPDPAEAKAPAVGNLGARGFADVTTRVLANGLTVVLLPLTSVPTVDVRVVFGAGTADDPAGRRGSALVAGNALSWDMRHLNDLLNFAAAGGTQIVDVGIDHTSFAARGLDMHLDFLLAGLRRWVRDGKYSSGTAGVVAAMRHEAKTADDDGALTDAWRAAVFGSEHPYVRAGLVRHTSDVLSADDAKQFRAAHFTPDNATLVISGRFDAALADRWVDHLFADWTGHAAVRTSPRSSPQPASIAKLADTAQAHLQIAIPSTVDRRAEELVATAMLSEIARDVRHQLGASYGLDAQLSEHRLATSYVISGWIDTTRAREAVELLRVRLETLRTDPDAAARSFVAARRQVLTHLVSVRGSAVRIAESVELDVALQRAPMSGITTAIAVQQLTIDAMGPTLAELDLSRAVVLMQGPEVELASAFAVLGRTPVYIRDTPDDRDARDPVEVDSNASEPERLALSEYTESLTEQGPPFRITFALEGALTTGVVSHHGVNGFTLAGRVGYRLDTSASIGLRAAAGRLTGMYDTGSFGKFVEDLVPIEVVPVSLGGFLHATGYDRIWGSLIVGLHLDRVIDNASEAAWHRSLGFGLDGGVDFLRLGRNRLGAFGRVEGELLSDVSFAAFTLGIAYRY